MPDLLSHVLFTYAVAGLVAWRTPFPDRFVPVVCVGAVMPDVMKAAVVAGVALGNAFGLPYSFWGIHTLGGVLVLGGLGALTIRSADRRLGFAALAAGGAGHLVLDMFVIRVDGLAPPYLFPITGWLPPAGTLYASSEIWPVVVALAVAIPVWLTRERQ
jgi:hypothetical protein